MQKFSWLNRLKILEKQEIADQVEALLVERSDARANKDWPRADQIRDQLKALGVVVTDTADTCLGT